MKRQVLVTDYAWPSLDIEREILARVGAELLVAETGEEKELLDLAPGVDAIMTCWKNVSGAVLDAAEQCTTVARLGVGLDNIDVTRASELGMLVSRVPDYCVAEVADHAMALLLSLARRVSQFDRSVRSGTWDNKACGPLPRLRGQVLGVVGFGRIGRAVVPRAQGFGLDTRVWARREPDDLPARVAYVDDLDTLVAEVDYLSLHVALSDETRHLIDKRRLGLMKPTAYLINTARGAVVDEDALADALQAGGIAGAALDVLTEEPADTDHPLVGLDRVLVTPHAGFYSESAIAELEDRAARNVAAVLSGETPPDPYFFNPAVLQQPNCRLPSK